MANGAMPESLPCFQAILIPSVIKNIFNARKNREYVFVNDPFQSDCQYGWLSFTVCRKSSRMVEVGRTKIDVRILWRKWFGTKQVTLLQGFVICGICASESSEVNA